MSQCFYRVSRILWYTISVKIPRHQMRGIKSKTHNLGTYKTNKISWSCFDDKGLSEMESKHLHMDIKTYKKWLI